MISLIAPKQMSFKICRPIHVDKKWFNIMKEKYNCYLASTKAKLRQTTKNKELFGKVMFLCEVDINTTLKAFLTIKHVYDLS